MIEAQLEAGYDSGSGFREAVTRLIGDSPAGLKGRELLRADWIETNSAARTHPVGGLQANPLGLFDVHGSPIWPPLSHVPLQSLSFTQNKPARSPMSHWWIKPP